MRTSYAIPWVDKRERMPEKGDGDEHGDVLAMDRNNGIVIRSVAFIRKMGGQITHWAPMPEPPPSAGGR